MSHQETLLEKQCLGFTLSIIDRYRLGTCSRHEQETKLQAEEVVKPERTKFVYMQMRELFTET